MNPLIQTTSKLFYGKWPFKLSCICKGSWMVKRLGIPKTIEFCLIQQYPARNTWGGLCVSPNTNKDELLAFSNAVESFLDKEIQIRVQGSTFNIYCKDAALFQEMISSLATWTYEIHRPANDVEHQFLDNSTKVVLCNHLPFKQYSFKVYIKSTTPASVRDNFKSWITHYDSKIRTPNHTVKWFDKGSGWGIGFYDPIIYVKDQSTLIMIGLFLGSNIQKVEEFIPRSSINTSTDQEQTCHL